MAGIEGVMVDDAVVAVDRHGFWSPHLIASYLALVLDEKKKVDDVGCDDASIQPASIQPEDWSRSDSKKIPRKGDCRTYPLHSHSSPYCYCHHCHHHYYPH